MHSPIASIVLVVELTHSGMSLLVPIVLAAAGATVISRALVPASLYTAAGWWKDAHATGVRRASWLRRATGARPGPSGGRSEVAR
jgi:H+/Cl- antiporter ClcA